MKRRTQRTLPLGMSETLSYNAAGNLASRADFKDKTTVDWSILPEPAILPMESMDTETLGPSPKPRCNGRWRAVQVRCGFRAMKIIVPS
jgi:YD repeat-containing protein